MAEPERLRVALVDASAIAHNVRVMRERVAPARVMVVVKADGYGHGALTAARAAIDAGADWLGVADLDEALALRDAGIDTPLLAWLHRPGASFDAAVARGISLGLSSRDQVDAAARAGSIGTPARIHLKVDTGLGRSGAPRGEWEALFARVAEAERAGSVVVEGLFSHLSNASEADDLLQLRSFEEATAIAGGAGVRPRLRHLAASAAALTLPQTHLDLVRIGICAYGLSPLDGVTSHELGLRPALSLRSRVISVKRVRAGSGVSYGYTYRTSRDSTLALVGLGYADGVPRHVSNRGEVSIRGRRHPIVGRVAMDQFVADLGDETAEVGDEVVLFGSGLAGEPTADDWAQAATTINYEIVTRLGPRIERRVVS